MQPFVNKKGGHKYEEKGISTGADRSNGGYSIGRLRKQRRHWFCIHNTRCIGGYSKRMTQLRLTPKKTVTIT